MALNGNTSSVRGALGKFDSIIGVESIKTKSGLDVIEFISNFSSQFDKLSTVLSDVSQRLSKLEKGGLAAKEDGPVLSELKSKIERFEKLLESDDLRGPSGPAGPKGEKGDRGPKVDRMNDIKNVSEDGVQDGCILVYRSGVWKAELPE
jgi:hypothetical protein